MIAGPRLSPTGACMSCGGPASPQDNFCESCGTELAPASVSNDEPAAAQACRVCPSAPVSGDGYCEVCGRKAPGSRDHQEVDLGLLAGVTDRGLRHYRNEDAMALATADTPSGPVALAVVCDGVSTSDCADEASLAAARAAIGVLLTAVRRGEDLPAASVAAVRSACEAVTSLDSPLGNAPSATFVSAVMSCAAVTVCWLGDSRAYWLASSPDSAAQRLTRDDSMAEELVLAGLLSEADALASPQAHIVTRWVGEGIDEVEPHVATFEPPGAGALLLCSDGLWNYQPEAGKLAELALPTALTDPPAAAAGLVNFALDAGGGDNVTVVLAPFPPTRSRLPRAPFPDGSGPIRCRGEAQQ